MGQITKAFAESILKAADNVKHFPLTCHEQKQLAVAWLEREELRSHGPNGGQVEIESLKVTLGCCLALMSQSGSPSCEEMARRIPFTIKNGEPYAMFSAPCATGDRQS